MRMGPSAEKPRSWMISKTMTARPAAGPLTWRGEPAIEPTTMPPMMPVRMPAAGWAPEAKAMPMQRGSATRKTTSEAERSLRCFGFIGIRVLRRP
jgi:hypothetical protein